MLVNPMALLGAAEPATTGCRGDDGGVNPNIGSLCPQTWCRARPQACLEQPVLRMEPRHSPKVRSRLGQQQWAWVGFFRAHL